MLELEPTRVLTIISYRATEMDITMIGLQNAGKTSLLRVLAVSIFPIGKWSQRARRRGRGIRQRCITRAMARSWWRAR